MSIYERRTPFYSTAYERERVAELARRRAVKLAARARRGTTRRTPFSRPRLVQLPAWGGRERVIRDPLDLIERALARAKPAFQAASSGLPPEEVASALRRVDERSTPKAMAARAGVRAPADEPCEERWKVARPVASPGAGATTRMR